MRISPERRSRTKVSGRRLPGSLPGLVLLAAAGLSACGGGGSPSLIGPDGATSISASCLSGQLATLPAEPLSADEQAAILTMREEEKLARDVYLKLYESWLMPIFANISDSEQTHTDAVLQLIERYGLVDPAAGNAPGEFTDTRFADLYGQLTNQGAASLISALQVGARIEDLDLYDIANQLATVVDNQDITTVWSNLAKGSRNHLRSFSARLADLGVTYTPQYISQADYDAIINSPYEVGGC